MLKILREILIYILLIALIVLVFGIIFYDHLPSNKLVPGKAQVALPEKLEEELEQALISDEQKEVIVNYIVEESDLDRYEDINKYNPGKIDPFSEYVEGNDELLNQITDNNSSIQKENSNSLVEEENSNSSAQKENSNSLVEEEHDDSSAQSGTVGSNNTGSSVSGQLTETKPGK